MHILKWEYGEAFTYFQAILAEWEKRPHWLNYASDTYLSILHNFLNTSQPANQKEAFRKKIEQLPSLQFNKKETRIQFQYLFYFQKLNYLLIFQPLSELPPFLAEWERWVEENEEEIAVAKRLAAFFNISGGYFVLGENRKANRWVNKILNTPGQKERKDLREFARSFQLVIHYELKNYELLEYLVRSTQRTYYRKGPANEFEKLLLDFFRQVIKEPNFVSPKESFENLRRNLKAVLALHPGFIPFGYTELSLWMKSKIEEVPISQCLEDRIQKFHAAAEKELAEKQKRKDTTS